MKKVLKFTLIVLAILLLKFSYTFFVNEIIINNYNNEKYNTTLIKTLYPLNFFESYIAYHNEGNLLYRSEKYSEAKEKYKKAIESNVPDDRICDVRINLSLAMLKEIDDSFDYQKAYNQLEEAKNNLYNNNCASPIDRSGSSQDAENLEEAIKQLQNMLNSSQPSDPQPSEEEGEDPSQGEEDPSIEEELRQRQREANSSRQESMESYEGLDNYEFYSGKRW